MFRSLILMLLICVSISPCKAEMSAHKEFCAELSKTSDKIYELKQGKAIWVRQLTRPRTPECKYNTGICMIGWYMYLENLADEIPENFYARTFFATSDRLPPILEGQDYAFCAHYVQPKFEDHLAFFVIDDISHIFQLKETP